MKKLCALVSIALVVTTLLSCSNVSETISEEGTSKISCDSTNDLLDRIDNINKKYQIGNSDIKKIKPGTAKKWGGRIFSAVVDGIGGYISGPAGWIVGPLCSWAFDEHWERCNRDVSHTNRPRKTCRNDSIRVPVYVVSKENLAHIDSIGYYHNLVLDKVSKTQHDYFNNDSTINYSLIYDDCQKASSDLDINTPKAEEKEKLIALSKFIVESIANCNDESELQNAFEEINNYYYREFTPDKSIAITEQVQKKIISVINNMTDEDDIKKYADEIYYAIYNSMVSPDIKEKAYIANSVTVNSKLYWDQVGQSSYSNE